MGEKKGYYIVDKDVLPEVFHHVLEVKKLLKSKKAATINEAVKKVGISRSTFYKYKDSIQSLADMGRGKIITLFFILDDTPGVLSRILNEIAVSESNILTINQNIPIHGIANVTITIDTKSINMDQDFLIEKLSALDGVNRIEIIAQE